MVHALEQAWRVLQSKGSLIDIRPAVAHSRVGVYCNDKFDPVGPSCYPISMYRNASQALRQVRSSGLFRQRSSTSFLCLTFSSLKRLQDWLTDSDSPLSEHKTALLMQRATQIRRLKYPNGNVAVRERIFLRVLEKIG